MARKNRLMGTELKRKKKCVEIENLEWVITYDIVLCIRIFYLFLRNNGNNVTDLILRI